MTDETKLAKQQLRGDEADRILNSPLFKEALDAVGKQVLDAFLDSEGDEVEVRERAYLMHRLHLNFKQFFVTHISVGKAAAKELMRLKEPSKIRRLIPHG